MPLEWLLRQPKNRHHKEQMETDESQQKAPLSIQALSRSQRNNNGRQEGQSNPGTLGIIQTDCPQNGGKAVYLADRGSNRANPERSTLNIGRIQAVAQLEPRPDRQH